MVVRWKAQRGTSGGYMLAGSLLSIDEQDQVELDTRVPQKSLYGKADFVSSVYLCMMGCGAANTSN